MPSLTQRALAGAPELASPHRLTGRPLGRRGCRAELEPLRSAAVYPSGATFIPAGAFRSGGWTSSGAQRAASKPPPPQPNAEVRREGPSASLCLPPSTRQRPKAFRGRPRPPPGLRSPSRRGFPPSCSKAELPGLCRPACPAAEKREGPPVVRAPQSASSRGEARLPCLPSRRAPRNPPRLTCSVQPLRPPLAGRDKGRPGRPLRHPAPS